MLLHQLYMRGCHRTLRRCVTSGNAPEGNTFREIAAALIDELEHRADLAGCVQPRNGLVVPVEHMALGVGA